jgi:hypothetical protein
LQLSPAGTIDISGLDIVSVSDLNFADGRIWIAEATTGGLVYAVNSNGALLDTVDPSVVPIASRLHGGRTATRAAPARRLCST